MKYTKIHLKNQDKYVYIVNDSVNIINEDGSYVSSPFVDENNTWFDPSEGWNSRKKNNKPIRIRVILGQACNYSCSYCTQKDIGNPNERVKNTNLTKFIDSVSKNLDLSLLKRVELWGGEPFLYWNDMIPLMEFFDNSDITFYISTNGSTLMEKHINFFNSLKGKVEVTISHDGPGQLELRGDEIFDKERVKKVVKMMDDSFPKLQYSFNSVLTNTNYNVFKINDFFGHVVKELDLKHPNIGFEIGRTYDYQLPDNTHYSHSYDNVIHGENLDKFQNLLTDYYYEQYQQHKYWFDNGMNEVESMNLIPCSNFIDNTSSNSVLGYVKYMSLGFYPNQTTNCGTDWEYALDVDLNGNVRTCQNVDESHIYGNINNIKGIRILSLDLDRKYQDHCSECEVKLLCKSSCPIKLPEKTFFRNCGVEKVWYRVHLLTALKIYFDDEVSIVEE